MQEAIVEAWPRPAGRVIRRERAGGGRDSKATDLVVSIHGCGALTDLVLDRAATARARVAVLPCCHDLDTCDAGGLTGWLDGPLAIDVSAGGTASSSRGYRIWTQTIPGEITPKNRLLMGAPREPCTGNLVVS